MQASSEAKYGLTTLALFVNKCCAMIGSHLLLSLRALVMCDQGVGRCQWIAMDCQWRYACSEGTTDTGLFDTSCLTYCQWFVCSENWSQL